MHEERKQRLLEFVNWVGQHITGDEKGEAQIFLDRLFQAFWQKGILEVGGHPEFRIRKAKEDGGGTAFADYVWKPLVLIEMKKRGEDLDRHYRQAFDYWARLVPDRPRYVVLCNFDEFRVYDFNIQMDTPVDTLKLPDLPERYGPLAFLYPTQEKPIFGNNHEAVTRKAADHLADCFNRIVNREIDRSLAQRFILQMLVALFSEDIGLLEKYMVARLLDDCKKPKDSYDLLGGLFVEMNTPGKTAGGRFAGVDYFNGGIFSHPARIELDDDELYFLKQAAQADWSKVRPEIFGTLFEHSLDKEERHAFGAHFTSPVDIMKIVGPTIVEPWREQIESAKTLSRLSELQNQMHDFRVLDPACGSGNFLYIAYRELKRLERRLYERMNELDSKQAAGQRVLGLVTARQFYGVDISTFAIELAKVTMMIARKLAIDELHINERPLPLDNLDSNFFAADALIDELGNPVQWPNVDVIIGNPPFLGAKRLKPEHGSAYINKIRKAYPQIPGMADYCVYWFRKAHDHLPDCTPSTPFSGRAGLVGTQNIRNNKSRVGGLDHIVETGTIIEAVDNQPWSGEANVHVSIANWAKTQDKKLLPSKRRLWFKVDSKPISSKKSNGNILRAYELSYRECTFINSALSDAPDVSNAKVLKCNTTPQRVFQGNTPGHAGFVLSPSERATLIRHDPMSADVIFPYLIGRELVTGDCKPERFVIDFQQMPLLDAQKYKGAFKRLKEMVLPDVEKKAKKEDEGETARQYHLQKWWMHWRNRGERLEAISPLEGRYIVCSRVTKRPIFVFVSRHIVPADALQTFAFDDDYSFGILQSIIHWQWFITKCAKLCERFTYNAESVFDTFPWPQKPNGKQIDRIAEAGRKIRHIRERALTHSKGGLRAVYRVLELPGKNELTDAHVTLDKAVCDAYGFSIKDNLLAQILELNLKVASDIEAGKPVTSPGIPSQDKNRKSLITKDCVNVE